MSEQGQTSGSYITVEQRQVMPYVDGHMHIQSNDIAPIPIIKGVALKNIFGFPNLIKPSHKINFFGLSFREVNEGDSKQLMPFFSVHTPSNMDDNRALMTYLIARLPSSIAQYGRVTRENSCHIAGVYMNEVLKTNIGIGSKRKLLIHANGERETIEHKTKQSITYRKRLVNNRTKTADNFIAAIGHYSNEDNGFAGSFDFSVLHGMELMYAHYWGAYGIPIYIMYDKTLYYVSNDFPYCVSENNKSSQFTKYYGIQNDIPGAVPRKSSQLTEYFIQNAYDIPGDVLEKHYRIIEKSGPPTELQSPDIMYLAKSKPFTTSSAGETEKYRHVLVPVEEKEICQFEDFTKHQIYTEMAILKYPFQFLAFYHVDARRFFGPDKINTKLHAFYRYDDAVSSRTGKNTLEMFDAETIAENITNTDTFIYKMKPQKIWDSLIEGGGLFWGIKLYAALGYPPYIFKDDYTGANKQVFSRLDAAPYAGLLDFFRKCAQKGIPVTCHASPQGMTIADPCVYLKEFLKVKDIDFFDKNAYVHFPTTGESFYHGLGLIDDFSSPGSWELVLEKLNEDDKKKFKLCLAHFGGFGFFNGTYHEDTPYNWVDKMTGLVSGDNGIYVDISCFRFKNIPLITDPLSPGQYQKYRKYKVLSKLYIQSGNNYFYRKEYFKNLDHQEKKELNAFLLDCVENESAYGEIKETALALKKRIDKNGLLRHRIIFGTDWPMTEMTIKGVFNYNTGVFLMLQSLTKLLPEWDAWHQFAVINPLAFLGLLNEEPNDDRTEYTFKTDRFTKLKDNMEKYLDSLTKKKELEVLYADDSSFKITRIQENIEKKYKEFEKKYLSSKKGIWQSPVIPGAQMIKNTNDHLILLDGFDER
jgi:hypothetical protein